MTRLPLILILATAIYSQEFNFIRYSKLKKDEIGDNSTFYSARISCDKEFFEKKETFCLISFGIISIKENGDCILVGQEQRSAYTGENPSYKYNLNLSSSKVFFYSKLLNRIEFEIDKKKKIITRYYSKDYEQIFDNEELNIECKKFVSE